jgi:hypothetical protein
MQTKPKEPRELPVLKTLDGLQFKVPKGEKMVIVFCNDLSGKPVEIAFKPLTDKYLLSQDNEGLFQKFGLSPEDLKQLAPYDREGLLTLKQRGKFKLTGGIPLDSEPPRTYNSPDNFDNGKIETKSPEFIAQTYGVSTHEYIKAYRLAQKIFETEIMNL